MANIARYLIEGDVAELGRYLMVREEYKTGYQYKYKIYLSKTGEYVDEFVIMKENKLYYREDTINKEGFIYRIVDNKGDKYQSFVWMGHDGTEKITGRKRVDQFSTYDWREFVEIVPTSSHKQEMFWLRRVKDGTYYICKTSGCIVLDGTSKESMIKKSDSVLELETDTEPEFAWITTFNGMYLMAQSETLLAGVRKNIRVAYKIAEREGKKWKPLEQAKVVTKAKEIREVMEFKGVSMEGFKEIEFGGCRL
jgi:hypothetical protein